MIAHFANATMSESKKEKEERNEEKEKKRTPKHKFNSICVFGESEVGKEREFIAEQRK